MSVESLILMGIIFIGVILIVSIEGIHCPYWQLPLGLSLLIGSIILSLIAPVTWIEVGLSWFFGAGTAILAVIVRTYKDSR
jgi:hypothetical protein